MHHISQNILLILQNQCLFIFFCVQLGGLQLPDGDMIHPQRNHPLQANSAGHFATGLAPAATSARAAQLISAETAGSRRSGCRRRGCRSSWSCWATCERAIRFNLTHFLPIFATLSLNFTCVVRKCTASGTDLRRYRCILCANVLLDSVNGCACWSAAR